MSQRLHNTLHRCYLGLDFCPLLGGHRHVENIHVRSVVRSAITSRLNQVSRSHAPEASGANSSYELLFRESPRTSSRIKFFRSNPLSRAHLLIPIVAIAAFISSVAITFPFPSFHLRSVSLPNRWSAPNWGRQQNSPALFRERDDVYARNEKSPNWLLEDWTVDTEGLLWKCGRRSPTLRRIESAGLRH
jgi:hypothetical protein